MQKFKTAFTMMELIFVIVILGILAGVAVPKFGDTKNQADIANARAQIASIRSGIVSERQTRLIRGDSNWTTATNLDAGGLFGGVLMYPLPNKNSSGNWYTATPRDGDYDYVLNGVKINFDYNATTGKFDCNTSNATCKKLVE